MTSVVTGCNGINGDIVFMPAHTLEAARQTMAATTLVVPLRSATTMCSDDAGEAS